MKVISISDFKRAPRKWFDVLKTTNERVMVKGVGDELFEIIPSAKISESGDYFANPSVQARLDSAIENIEAGNVKEISLSDLTAFLQ